MRVYHFVSQKNGLDDIRKRRLKIATIADVNDPFELVPSSKDKNIRQAFRAWREQFDSRYGMLCFSRSWRNPVQWSHYAAKHTGLCLGFEIQENLLTKVRYRSERLQARVDFFGGPNAQSEMLKLLSTKYKHWRYENEMRLFARLNDRDPKTGYYFADFSRKMSLEEVIAGPLSTLKLDELRDVLGTLQGRVDVYKARLAFRTYTVTRQLNPALWQ